MNLSPLLYAALQQLDESAQRNLLGSRLDEIKLTIHRYAIYSAVASVASNVLPGMGALAAIVAQTTLVWTMYVKINRTLGVSMSENTAKFVGSAMLTNMATNAGAMIVAYAASAILAWVPFFGQAAAAVTEGALGYMVIYISAALYLRLLTKVMKATGSYELEETEDTKAQIKEVVKETNMKDLIREAKDSYKAAKANGEIDAAKKHAKCPHCDADVTMGQKFCSNCGQPLS